ncbi:hypothetical protein C8Q76DRAFT_790365 [Earliella scabrosa]|nr:hypothetical protein C8Q76DRAFT_790365 [Earliella scabrosa]
MKRAAEKQLIKDQDEDGDDEVEEVPGSGFKKADESVLARRQIRALPRRSLAGQAAASGATPPSSTEQTEPAPVSKFAGFSGFGAPAAPSAPFSFTSPAQPPGAPKLTPAVPAVSPFGSSSTSSQSVFGPSVSSSASAATKTFANIVSSSSLQSEPKAPAVTTPDEDMSEVEYYKAIRGLNISFLSAVSKAIESDPFVDVAELLERYKSLRVSVKSDFDGKSKPASSMASAPTSSFTAPPKVSEPPKPPASFSMPAAPSGFAGFPSVSSSSASSTPASGGFTPKFDSGKPAALGTPFNLAPSSKAAESSSTEAPKPAFTFGAPSSTSTSTSTPSAPPTSAFKFGPPSNSSAFSGFGGSSSTTSSSTPSLFGSSAAPSSSSIFGSSSTTTPSPLFSSSSTSTSASSIFGSAKDADKPPAPVSIFGTGSSSSSTPFGTGTSTGATTPEKDKDKDKEKQPAFTFGSASPGKPSLFSAGFGAAKAGSIGNPVGFGFGSPPKTPDEGAGSKSGPINKLPFSFGAPAQPAFTFGGGSGSGSSAVEGGESEKKDASSAEGTPAPDAAGAGGDQPPPPPLIAGTSVHDQEGEGEEHEETTHEIRSKVYKMTKDKEGKAQWGDMGVGMLRLKKHKETGSRRVLLRNSSTGKITINFLIHSGMNAAVADKTVSFMGHEEGVSTPYRIRMKTNEQAKELKAALDREIEFVKSKTGS